MQHAGARPTGHYNSVEYRPLVLLRVGLLVSVAGAAAAGCVSGEASTPDNVLVVGIRAAPNHFDPRLANDITSARVAQMVFSSLLDIGEDLRVTPTLAERLEQPDALTYIVHLRRGVTFHDGHELTAADVVYTYGAFLDPAFVSPYKSAYRLLSKVSALDDYTVEFRLKEPFAAFPIQLVTPPVVPAGAGESLRTFPIGTGPYRFVRYDVDDQVVLAAFEDYYGGRPKNDGVILKVLPDDTMRSLELRKGSIDLTINDLPPDIVHELSKDSRMRVMRSPGMDYSYLGFNMRDAVVADKRVRHAIAHAINRDAIATHLQRGLAHPADSPVPRLSWSFEPDVYRFAYDPARAKRLLDEAGYPDRDGDGPLPRLRLVLKTSTVEDTRIQATVIQQDLRRVGIDLEIQSYEFATYFADVLSGNFQIHSLQWVGGALVDPDILRRMFHSAEVPPNGFNRGYYSNPEADRVIDLATRATDEAERKKYYGELQKLIAEDAPYISLWQRMNFSVARSTLQGLQLGPIADFQVLRHVTKSGVNATAVRVSEISR